MAYSFSWGYNPAQITGKNVSIDTIDPDEYVTTSQLPDEVVETNLASPMGRPEKFTFGRRIVKDIYANSDVDTAYRCPTKAGIKLLVNWETIASLTESTDPTFRMDFPISIRTTVTVPASDYLTADNVLLLVRHQFGAMFAGSTDVTSARIAKLLKGALPMA